MNQWASVRCRRHRELRPACPVAHTLDVVGGRWTLLIVRDLLFGPLRFTDLRDGLPGLAPNLLSERFAGWGPAGWSSSASCRPRRNEPSTRSPGGGVTWGRWCTSCCASASPTGRTPTSANAGAAGPRHVAVADVARRAGYGRVDRNGGPGRRRGGPRRPLARRRQPPRSIACGCAGRRPPGPRRGADRVARPLVALHRVSLPWTTRSLTDSSASSGRRGARRAWRRCSASIPAALGAAVAPLDDALG